MSSAAKSDPVAYFIGWLLGTVVIGFLTYVVRRPFVWLHRRFPFTMAGIWVSLLSLFLYLRGDGWASLLLLLAASAVWYFRRSHIRRWLARRRFAASVHTLMEMTLWNNHKVKTYIKISNANMSGVYQATFYTPSGEDDAAVLALMPKFSSHLGLASVIPLPDENEFDGTVSVLFCITNPLDAVLDGSAAPVLHMTEEEKSDPLHWLDVGVDAAGRPYQMPLFLEEGGAVRQLTAGTSGSGKSSIVRQQILQAVLNPHIDVYILDGKGSEFGIFEPYTEKFETADGFWNLLRALEEETSRRAKTLQANKVNQTNRMSQSWNAVDDGSYLLFVWDELGATLGKMNNAQKQEAYERLFGVLSVGRSLGVGVILSSQTFPAHLLPTNIRDNCFDLSVGFKMGSLTDAGFIGFENDAEVNPAKIKGKMLPSGRSSSVGTFATVGLRNSFGRSYFVSDGDIKRALSEAKKHR